MSHQNIIFTDDDHRISWIAFLFLCFVSLFEAFCFRVGYSDYFIFLFDNRSGLDILIIIFCQAISFYIFFKFIALSLSSSRFYKLLYFLFFVFAISVEYSYQKALGRFFEPFDIENAVTTTTEQKIASLSLYFDYQSIIPCFIFLLCLIFFGRKNKAYGFKKLVSFVILITIFFAAQRYFGSTFIEQNFPTVSAASFLRTDTDFLFLGSAGKGGLISKITGSLPKRKAVKKPELANEYRRPSNNIVFVVDESVRGDHLSLNGYSRNTTPFLDDLSKKGILRNWGIAASASTGSRFSYNTLVTGLTVDDFPDKTNSKVNSSPTIFQYAKAMNYTTYFFDGQMKVYWGGIEDDKNYIDNWQGVEKNNDHYTVVDWEIDNHIAKEINRIISTSTGNFIFVFKRGSHIPYHANFPASEAVWQPSFTTGISNKYEIPGGDQLQEVANAYDNSLKFNINSFFKNLVDDYSNIPNDSMIIYTSDHGQTLFANGKAAHGGSSKEEAIVPLFIIGNLKRKAETNFKAAHQNLFLTTLDLMDYPAELCEENYAPSLLKTRQSDTRPRFFNPNLGAKIPFD